MEVVNLQSLICSTFVVVICFIHVSGISAVEASAGGFSVDLISRDSTVSPFYNPSETEFHRLEGAFRRSMSRANHFSSSGRASPNGVGSEVTENSGEYLMNISLGTPPFPILAIADTGSDLTWTQCEPCPDCYKQVAPLFNPKDSSTYKELSCDSEGCKALNSTSCVAKDTCEYSYSYGNQSFTKGYLASETVTFPSGDDGVSFNNHMFGCGHENAGPFNEKGSGIVGLGGGKLSLISQLASTVGGQFSYCLVPSNSAVSSKINFGSNGVVSGSGVVSTPLVKKSPDTFYYLTLEGLSVGALRLEFKRLGEEGASPEAVEEGNIIIDSGTRLTLLPVELYRELEKEIVKIFGFYPETDPSGTLKLCYKYVDNLLYPTITFHFRGADLELPRENTFIIIKDLVCLSMASSDKLAIFGNLAQVNFLVGYDLENGKISFKKTDCTKS